MDPRIPYSQSTGYTGLLYSQHESVYDGNSPYESFPSGSSQIPQFSSQQCEAPTPPTHPPVERGRRHKWTPAEDEMLISVWLNTSKDAIVGNNQKSGTFWKRVGDYFFAALSGGDCVESSEHVHYKQRWHKISNDTSKFCGAYAAAERQISSGQHENDVLKVAHEIFFADQGSKFTLEHVWCVLRYEQKWLNLNSTKASESSKRKTVESDSQTSTTSVGEEEIRPEGVKAAKAKHNANGKSVDYYTTVLELRKVDLDRKEKLQKLAILDTLLAKTQPLSEAEEAAKNKLLAYYNPPGCFVLKHLSIDLLCLLAFFGLHMGLDYSYSQPSQDETFGGAESDSDYNEVESLIQQDQAHAFVYPPQPEVEFGFPQICYCGSEPKIATSSIEPGRRYYTCTNANDGECHVWKWWDEAVMEEMRARDRHTFQLAEKVDSLTFFNDHATEQKLVRLENMVCELAKNKSKSSLDYFVAVMVMVLIFIGVILVFL
uniref:No apical meristem-associated C-terminal domain-containing protein n=3 Tax=Brassica oleracea var. oleracea TaxID=109376 RepID=A0A0D3CPF8_BRAOL